MNEIRFIITMCKILSVFWGEGAQALLGYISCSLVSGKKNGNSCMPDCLGHKKNKEETDWIDVFFLNDI